MRHTFANAHIHSNVNANGDAGRVGYANGYAYGYVCRFTNPDAKLLARLHNIGYHWHDNGGRHRYR
jgi:hypothetical protein